ncbi:MAG: hypothetical protein FWG71_08040 [Synergistaceae bacterium]|nr:hypothetical protein [Synergistaceae bacterium]
MAEDTIVKLLDKLDGMQNNLVDIKIELGVIKNDVDWIRNGHAETDKALDDILDDVNHMKAELKSFHTAFKVLYTTLGVGFATLFWVLDKAGVWAKVFE